MGTVYDVKKFIALVKCGEVIDDDGYGMYIDKDGHEIMRVDLDPYEIKKISKKHPEIKGVRWYNR